jgi:hypothetical protein
MYRRMMCLISVIVVAFRNPPRWRSMLLPAQGCRRAAQVHLRGDSRRPSFELRVDRHPGRIFLPFWPGRGARFTSSGVGGKELLAWDLRTPLRAIRHFLISQGRALSFVSWVELAKARSIACAVEPVSLGCDQGTSRERRHTRAHPPTTDIASSGGDARSRRADLEPQGSRRGCRPPCPPPGQSERVRSHRVPPLHTAREPRIMPRATPP